VNKLKLAAALLGSVALVAATPAFAQTPATISQEEIEFMRAQMEAMKVEIDALKAAQSETEKKVEKTATINWKGAPELSDAGGWSFKPRGRLMYDAGYVSSPGDYSNPGLGFANEIRRARLGVEGSLPGKFGYKFEVDFASGDVEFADAILTYSPGPWKFTVGQHNNFQSLEELTSSVNSSFIERAAFTDAFNFERRVGLSAQWKKNAFLAQGGVFTDSISDLNSVGDDNNSYSFDGRLVFMPKMGKNQLHLAGSMHHRELKDAATSVRFRQRPAIHTTDVRFIDTGNITGARAETDYGVEAAGIFGSFYVASEAHWMRVSRDGFENPSFFGAYVDAGYFFTGETRGYKDGAFDRVKVKNPVGKGGWGSLGANVRWDYLNLNDGPIRGGKQERLSAVAELEADRLRHVRPELRAPPLRRCRDRASRRRS
jgi:phosphate-selective porin OprO and OprP